MSSKLKDWIHPEYLELYRCGRISQLRESVPFKHAVLENFLKPEALARVLEHCASNPQERSHRKGIAARADWYWGAFSLVDYLRFYLGREMRDFMSELMGEKLVLKAGAVPQFNTFRPLSPGLPVHTDMNENIGIVTLLQLSQGYAPGGGGELIFHRREKDRIVPDKVIRPICNTLILFRVSPISYHSVADMHGSWTRRTITYDWLAEEGRYDSLSV